VPTYVTLITWTQQGIGNIKQSPGRVDAAKDAFKKAGGEIKGFYLLMGQYDIMLIGEATDDTSAARLALGLGAQGNVRTQTMRAFTESEYRQIIASLP